MHNYSDNVNNNYNNNNSSCLNALRYEMRYDIIPSNWSLVKHKLSRYNLKVCRNQQIYVNKAIRVQKVCCS